MSDRAEEPSTAAGSEGADAESDARSAATALGRVGRLLGRSGSANTPGAEAGSTSDRPSRWRAVGAWFSLSTYFSPVAYLALVAILAVGLLAGALALPVAGSVVGMFVAAAAVGALDPGRRYAEMTAAGGSIAAVSVLADYTLPALGDAGSSLAVGSTASLLACLVGYYVGRNLRSELDLGN